MEIIRRASEALARRTSRRSLFGSAAGVAFGALAGAAAGTIGRRGVSAGGITSCFPPGPLCECASCQASGVCAKPCIILTTYYASGCWVSPQGATCCDCDCHGTGVNHYHACGCATDYHNDPANCPP